MVEQWQTINECLLPLKVAKIQLGFDSKTKQVPGSLVTLSASYGQHYRRLRKHLALPVVNNFRKQIAAGTGCQIWIESQSSKQNKCFCRQTKQYSTTGIVKIDIFE